MNLDADGISEYSLLGGKVCPLTMDDLNAAVRTAIEMGHKRIIASLNLHALYVFQQSSAMHNLHWRDECLVRVDGMSIVAIGRLLGLPLLRRHRVTWVDWINPLLELAGSSGWRVYYLGGEPGVAERGIQRLRDQYPALEIWSADGYFELGGPEDGKRLAAINAVRPHILVVGMGMPRQEQWIHDNFDKIDANIVLTSGAAIEYVAGTVATPPRWMGRLGLEWLFRLAKNPRRFWRRYLVEPWHVLVMLGPELFHRIVGLRNTIGREGAE